MQITFYWWLYPNGILFNGYVQYIYLENKALQAIKMFNGMS